MTLRCSNCGSYALKITSQSYSDWSAFEAYECEHCGATGTLTNGKLSGTRLSGDIESDGGNA